MRNILLVAALAATLTACTGIPPSNNQLELANRLKASPSRTILVTFRGDAGYAGGQKMAFIGYEEVCGIQGSKIEVARVGSWGCPSSDSKLDGLGTDTPINIITKHLVLRVIQPGDTDYNEHLKRMMALEILHQPSGPNRI